MNNHRPPRSSRHGGSQAARGTHQEKAANGVMAVAQRIRKLREGKGLSQGDIERATGMLRGYISRVENGHTVPSVETLERFAMALDVPLYQLFCEGEDAPPAPNLRPPKSMEQPEQPGSNGSEIRLLTMLKVLTSRMLDSDRRLLLDLANRLASHQRPARGGSERIGGGATITRPRSG